MAWRGSFATHIWIFAVGRGNAAFIRTGLNQGFVLDMNATDFDVAAFLKKRLLPKIDDYKGHKIAQAILSHPHADHIAQCSELQNGKPLYPTLLTCPHEKDFEDGRPSNEKLNWARIKNRDGDGETIASYKSLYAARHLPLQTIQYAARWTIPNFEYGLFYIRPPICEQLHPTDDNAYANSTSIVFYLRHGANSILFPGDMTPEGMKHILEDRAGTEKRYTVFDSQWTENNKKQHFQTAGQPSLKSLLAGRGLSVLVAPHHGLESCFSEDLFDAIRGGKPRLIVISERRHSSLGDGKTHPTYQSEKGASGTRVSTEGVEDVKLSLTTKNGHHILITFESSGGPRVFADRDPEKLLARL